jgi:hypothetical protein
VPEDFKGVQEIRVKDKALEIVEQDNGRIVKIGFDRSRLR